MWNMHSLVRSALDADDIGRVIVSNNNPAHRLRDWVQVADSRLVLIDQRERCGCAKRYELARDDPADHFVCFDDDVLLTPAQITGLLRELAADPAVPHGISGSVNVFGPDGTVWRTLYYSGQEMEVDILHTTFAFTRQHVAGYFESRAFARRRGMTCLEIADDILVSHSTSRRPRIHDLGPHHVDATWNDPNIALFLNPVHQEARGRLVELFARRDRPTVLSPA
jgi:hypothetical protein